MTDTVLATPGSQISFDRSAHVRPCSSQVLVESALSLVPEISQDEVFAPHPSTTTATTTRSSSSTTTTTASTTDTTTDTNTNSQERQGQKPAPASSDTSYSRGHRTTLEGASNYPKRPNRPHILTSSDDDKTPPPRPRRRQSSDTDYSREHRAEAADLHRYPKRQLRDRILTILGKGPVFSILTLLTIIGLLFSCPTTTANRFTLRNAYGTVEPRYQLTAYDCSDPTEEQAYSSIPERQCSIRTTPVQRDRPMKLELLLLPAYYCSLSRTDIR